MFCFDETKDGSIVPYTDDKKFHYETLCSAFKIAWSIETASESGLNFHRFRFAPEMEINGSHDPEKKIRHLFNVIKIVSSRIAHLFGVDFQINSNQKWLYLLQMFEPGWGLLFHITSALFAINTENQWFYQSDCGIWNIFQAFSKSGLWTWLQSCLRALLIPGFQCWLRKVLKTHTLTDSVIIIVYVDIK